MNKLNDNIDLLFTILNGKVSMAINRRFYRDFKKAGLEFTPEQWTVLSCLWNKEGVTQQELCNLTFKDKPSMTRLIDNLEKQGYVIRASDSEDRRTNLIYLTNKGKKNKSKATETVLNVMKEALNGIESEEIDAAKNVLIKVFDNLKITLA